MRLYTFSHNQILIDNNNGIYLSDGQAFILIFSAKVFEANPKHPITISITFINNQYYQLALNRSSSQARIDPGSIVRVFKLGQYDTDVTVRIEKDSPTTFTSYVNGNLIDTTTVPKSRINKLWLSSDTNGVAKEYHNISLMVLDENERKSNLIGRGGGTGTASGAAGAGGTGSSGGGSSLGGGGISPSVNPPDATEMKLSATVAWPRATNQIVGSTVYATIQARHDTLMNDWVIARGDNLSSNSYDYFVYSRGVVWAKAILENTTSADLAKIRDREAEILKVLL